MSTTMKPKASFRSAMTKRFSILGALEAGFGMVAGGFGAREIGAEERLLQRAANDAAQR